MASDPLAIMEEHDLLAGQLVGEARDALNAAAQALGQAGSTEYTPFEFSYPVMAFGSPNVTTQVPGLPQAPNLDNMPNIQTVPVDVPDFTEAFSAQAPTVPSITIPSDPSPYLPSSLTAPAMSQNITLPSSPSLLPLPSTTLPYPTLNIPSAPVLVDPTFSGVAPDPIQSITLADYLALLTATYQTYSNSIPALVQSNWRQWYATLMSDHPLLGTMLTAINGYLATGGSGVPTTVEDAIVTRAQDRVSGEQKRASGKVWQEMAKRGLWMPSGALLSGLKEAAQLESEAVSKVTTDVAIKNIELEHDHMKFMLDFGKGMETLLCGTSMEIAKVQTELNGQAIEITKTVLTGMIEINKAIIQIYLARWEGYKAGVEVYKAQIEAQVARITMYKAQIEAELAKTEIDKATVAILEAIINANQASVNLYKAQIEGETAKLEIDRTRATIFEAQTRGFVAQVEAYRARWDGYSSQVKGQEAKAQVYAEQVKGYVGLVDAYRAKAGAYEARTRGFAARTDAASKSNVSQLAAWTAKAEGLLKAYGYNMEAYRTQWTAAVEQMKIQSTYWQSSMESIRAFNTTLSQQQMELGRENLAQWSVRLESTVRAAQGLQAVGNVYAQTAGSIMAGVTSLAAITEQVAAA
jgi:hypothetical protein